ncbi:MAG: ATP-binding protein [Candidatus Eremiobacteraeota bacterium]|nr:ATP-binding protein [Candidatus Eremiobacteraeota bacterium]
MHWRYESRDAHGAYDVRSELIAHLQARATDDSDIDAAALVFGELVANVVRHAPGPISIALEWDVGIAVLRVRDSGPGFDWRAVETPEPLAESGRGLFIVRALARHVQVRRCEPGTEAVVWLPVQHRSA